MTQSLFLDDTYLQTAESAVVGHTPEGGIILAATIFFPTDHEQPGDSGRLEWNGGTISIATSIKGDRGAIVLVPSEPTALPPVNVQVLQRLDWGRRHRHMRIHTALHLLSVVIPSPITSTSIGTEKGSLDFAMDSVLVDKITLENTLNALIEQDLPVSATSRSDTKFPADSFTIKAMSGVPQTGQGHVRLVRIGDGITQVDEQPCWGTHVARTSEIGRIRFGDIEEKGRMKRRVTIHLD